MKDCILKILSQSVTTVLKHAELENVPNVVLKLEACKNKEHGDYASNIAMLLSKILKRNPIDIAHDIIRQLPQDKNIKKTTVAGPGFINFFLNHQSQSNIIKTILKQQLKFGAQTLDKPLSICIEYVSANPTGPLHVGHGRGAAFGDSLAKLLSTLGHKVHTEYYVNDAGRQMDILTISVWIRYLNFIEHNNIPFPTNAYQGDYILDIAKNLYQKYDNKFFINKIDLYQDIDTGTKTNDEDKYIDKLIVQAKTYLQHNYNIIFNIAIEAIINNIKQDLSAFGIEFDQWFFEKSLIDDTNSVIEQLQKNNYIYSNNNCLWFKSTDYNDEKDRVVVRSNGAKTYFASDISYHKNKIDRGFDKLINIWGADHHGYISRVKAGMQALGFDSNKLIILLVQFANLFRNNIPVPMSTRSGSFVTLAELYNEVGVDATRFFYVQRKPEQHLDFDLELAKAKNSENPVYYVQYAYARIHQVIAKLENNNLKFDEKLGLDNLNLLTSTIEVKLIKKLNQYPDLLKTSGENFTVHQITTYLRTLSHDFHGFYNTHKFIVDNDKLRNARICLIKAIAQTIQNGLKILGVSAPKNM